MKIKKIQKEIDVIIEPVTIYFLRALVRFQSMDKNLRNWRASGAHLPEFMRDFHDQKAVFRTMHAMLEPPEQGAMIRRPDLAEGHVYVVDCFLWFMARHGYTLQKSRARQNFESLPENIAAVQARQAERWGRLFKKNGTPECTPDAAVNSSQGP